MSVVEPEDCPTVEEEIKIELTKNGSQSFVCTICQKRFGGQTQCKRHITMAHKKHSKQHSRAKQKQKPPIEPETLPSYTCELCSATYKTLPSYKQHLDKHAGMAPPKKATLPCEHCEATFTSREGRRVHMILKHSAGTTYKCPECPMIFARKGNLRLHSTTHGMRQHVCSVCGKPYARIESLKAHETACAAGNSGLNCEVCGQRFRKPELLDKHRQQGHPEKEHECDHCGQAFETKRALSHHVRVHEGTFKCDHCPLLFVTEKALRNHERGRHWEVLGIERVVGKQGRRKDGAERTREPRKRVRRNKHNPFLGLEHLVDGKEGIAADVGKLEEEEQTEEAKVDPVTDIKDETIEDGDIKQEENVEEITQFEDTQKVPEKQEIDESATLKDEALDVSDQDNFADDDSHVEDNDSASEEQDIFKEVEVKQEQQNQKSPRRTRARRPQTTNRKSKAKNPHPKKFNCSDCDKSFVHEYWLYVHQVKVHGAEEKSVPAPKKHRSHFCEHCSKCFSDWRNLMYHLRHIHGIKVDELQLVQCPSCRRRFLSKADLDGHSCLKGTHFNREPTFRCELCDKPYYSQHGLESHKSSHPEYHRVNCDVCRKPFANEKDMIYHKKRVHVEANLVCEVCGKSFKVASQLKIHVQIHQRVKSYQCEFCGKSFSQRNGMTAHLRISHADQLGPEAMAEREIACEICGKKLKGKICFRLHMKTHTNERPFQCSYCDKRFIARQDQTRHEQTHTKEYRFKCRFCDKGSTRRRLIQLHEAREHGFTSPGEVVGPRHECPVCGKCFSSPSALKIHESLHSDALPVWCDLCDLRFKNVKYMKYHLKAHHAADGSGTTVKAPRKRKVATVESKHQIPAPLEPENQLIHQQTVQVTLPVTNPDGSSSVVFYSAYEIQPPPS